MRAIITNKSGFNCAPEGHTAVNFPFGAEVDGQVAVWAVRTGNAERLDSPVAETKVVIAPERKRGRKK